MMHQSGKSKLNVRPAHRKALVRNQVIHLVKYGFLHTTKARAKEVQRLAEKITTMAKEGSNFNTIRRIKQMLPYDEVIVRRIISEIAPKYLNRPGGYTRLINLGRRPSDTASIARLEWV
jgi:large subunit ribosomal protein L17